jgi:hypothetical protein
LSSWKSSRQIYEVSQKDIQVGVFPDIFARFEPSRAMLEARTKEVVEPFPTFTGGGKIPSFDRIQQTFFYA